MVFYIREATVNTAEYHRFLQARLGEVPPAHDASTTLVRYAGMTIDGSGIQSALDDSARSGQAAAPTSRLTAFLDAFKGSLTWSVYEIPSLTIGFPRTAQEDRDILARRYNVPVSNSEPALVLALASGSLVISAVGTLNSAVHVGLDLGQRIRSDQLSALRGRLYMYLGSLPPLESTPAPAVGTPASRFQAVKAHFVAAKDRLLALCPVAGHLGTTATVPGILSAASHTVAGAAAVSDPRRILHIFKDTTLGDMLGKTTMWGPLAGSGPTIHGRSLARLGLRSRCHHSQRRHHPDDRHGGTARLDGRPVGLLHEAPSPAARRSVRGPGQARRCTGHLSRLGSQVDSGGPILRPRPQAGA